MADYPHKPRLLRTRRDLLHWRIEGSTYFVTWRLAFNQPELRDDEKDLVAGALRNFNHDRYRLYCFVVMPDHVHVILLPAAGYALSKILQSWKSFTAHELVKRFGRLAPIWLPESMDRILRSEEELWEKVDYILTNPQRRFGSHDQYRWAVWLKGQAES